MSDPITSSDSVSAPDEAAAAAASVAANAAAPTVQGAAAAAAAGAAAAGAAGSAAAAESAPVTSEAVLAADGEDAAETAPAAESIPAVRYIPAENCKVKIVVAMGLDHAIGERGVMPWYLPADLKHFKAQTLHSCVIMGRKTFESIGRPLPSRRNIVVTSNEALKAREDIETAASLEEAMTLARTRPTMVEELTAAAKGWFNSHAEEQQEYDQIVLIGGQQIFTEGLEFAEELCITEIRARFPHADTHFPEFEQMGVFLTDDVEPHITDQHSYFFCEAIQPNGFAQDIPDFDEEDVLINEERRPFDIENLPQGLAYRYLTYRRSF